MPIVGHEYKGGRTAGIQKKNKEVSRPDNVKLNKKILLYKYFFIKSNNLYCILHKNVI